MQYEILLVDGITPIELVLVQIGDRGKELFTMPVRLLVPLCMLLPTIQAQGQYGLVLTLV
jgi:hypothetical protein